MKITIKYIPNIFEKDGRKQITIEKDDQISLYKALFDLPKGFIPEDKKRWLKTHKIIVNGVKIDGNKLKEYELKDGDEVIIIPEVKAALGVAVLGALVGAGLSSAITGGVIASWVMIGFAIGGLVGSIIFPPFLPSTSLSSFDSATYNWDGMRSVVRMGDAVPLVYGEHRVPLRVVNAYVNNNIQYEYEWAEITPNNIVNSGYTNQFTVNAQKVKISLIPHYVRPQIDKETINYNKIGKSTAVDGTNSIITSGQIKKLTYDTSEWITSLYSKIVLLYKIEYKKSSDASWTEYGYFAPYFFIFPSFLFPPFSDLIFIQQYVNKDWYGYVEIDTGAVDSWDFRITLMTDNVDNTSYLANTKFWAKVKTYPHASTSKPDKSYLNVLGVLSEGEVEEIDINSIEINGNPIYNYDENTINIETRNGTNDQSIISGFNETHSQQSIGVKLLKNSPYTHTTVKSNVEAFEIEFVLNGLYQVNTDDGSISSWSVVYKVEYKLHTDSDWTDLGEITITAKQQSRFTKKFRKDNLTAGQYDIRITRTSDDPDFYHIGDIILNYVDEITYDDIAYVNRALMGIKLLATEKLSGTMPTITTRIKGIKVLQPKLVDSDGIEYDYDDYYYDNVNECYRTFSQDTLKSSDNSEVNTTATAETLVKTLTVNYSDLSPYFKIQDESKGSGEVKVKIYIDDVYKESYWHEIGDSNNYGVVSKTYKLSDLGTGTTVKFELYLKSSNGSAVYNREFSIFKTTKNDTLTWDGSTWVKKYSANPIWIMYDLITNERYGIGKYMKVNLPDTSSLVEMAKYCDTLIPREQDSDTYEKRFRLDVVIDTTQKALDLLSRIASTFRGFIFVSEGTLKITIDKPETPTQLFTMGNILAPNGKSSFQESFSSYTSIPNYLEVQFLNSEKNYERDMVAFEDQTSLASGEPLRKKSLALYGITRPSQALRLAKYYWAVSKYCSRVIEFQSMADAIACTPGDVISFQHDVPFWSSGGRIMSGSTISKVILDQNIALASGSDYQLKVRFSDDTIETRDISSGSSNTVYVSSPFSQAPQYYDLWALGEKNNTTKPFRVISLSLDTKETVKLTALEYNETVYDDITGIVLPTPNYSMFSTLAPCENITLSEGLVKLKDGSIEDAIYVSFNKPQNSFNYGGANIYLSDNNGESWDFRGKTTGNTFTIVGGIKDGNTYTVAVASVDTLGSEISENLWITESITIVGKSAPPEDVSGFIVSQNYDKLEFRWNAVSDIDFDYYEIRRGANWDTAQFITTVHGTSYTLLSFPYGEQTYLIKARDTSGNYSTNPAIQSINITEIPNRKEILQFTDNLEGTIDSNLDYEWNESNSDRFRKCVLLKTQNVWDNSTDYWDYPVVSEAGYYTSTTQDVGEVVNAIVFVSLDIASEGSNASYSIEERHSTDNINWSSWQTLPSTAITFRYIQTRVKLYTTDVNENIRLYSLEGSVNLPEISEKIENQYIASGGSYISFTKQFHTNDLSVVVTPINSAYKPYTSNISSGGCYVYLTQDVLEYDENGDLMPVENVFVNGYVSIVVKGY